MKKIILILCFLLSTISSYSQCAGYLVGYFPDTVNGITITTDTMGAVGAGSPNPTNTYTDCGVVSRSVSLGAAYPASSFTQTLNFSSSVNNIVYILLYSDSTGGAAETFSFTVNTGTLTCTQAGSSCPYTQSGNFFSANSSLSYNGHANAAYITLHSTMPYTSLTVTGPGGFNGSMMSLCANSITNGIKNNFYNEQIKIYPNPANNKITINANNVVEVKLFDVLDKQIINTKDKEIDISNFNDGVYFIQVLTNQNRYTQKIIVQH